MDWPMGFWISFYLSTFVLSLSIDVALTRFIVAYLLQRTQPNLHISYNRVKNLDDSPYPWKLAQSCEQLRLLCLPDLTNLMYVSCDGVGYWWNDPCGTASMKVKCEKSVIGFLLHWCNIIIESNCWPEAKRLLKHALLSLKPTYRDFDDKKIHH